MTGAAPPPAAGTMRFRTLGATGLSVSEIGFGTWGLGGDSYGTVDDAQSRRVLEGAFDRGVTFYDTSDLYGAGHAERVLGEALGAVRDSIVIATKGGLLPHTGFAMPQDFSASHLRAALMRSLDRLRTDYVDLYQLHSPELSLLRRHPEILDTLRAFREDGLIRHWGLSARSPADAAAALAEFEFPVIQVNFNLIDHRAVDSGLLDAAAAQGVGVIARTPLCFGYLSGRLTGNERFDSGRDHRANWPQDQLRRWAEAPGLFDPLVRSRGCTPAQFALLFCLAQPAVSTAIPGLMSMAELDEDIGACALDPLTEDELAEIDAIYRSRQFYDPAAKAQGTA